MHFDTAHSVINAFLGQGQHWSLSSYWKVLQGVLGRRELSSRLNTQGKAAISQALEADVTSDCIATVVKKALEKDVEL